MDKILGVPNENEKGNTPSVSQRGVETKTVNGGSTTTKPGGTTTHPVTTTQPGGNDGEQKHFSLDELAKMMEPYREPTEEEIEKEKKRYKRDRILAAIGDGLSAFNYAYSTSRGVKPMADPRNSMSQKVRSRYEQMQKEREANKQAYMQAYMKGMQLEDEAKRDERNWRRTLERDKKADDNDKRDFDNKVKQQEVQNNQWKQSFERQGEQWKQQFNESKRQFNVSSSHQAERIGIERQRIAREMQNDSVTFAIGQGNGTISVPKSALNASNVSYVFSKLPADVKDKCKGEPIYNKLTGAIDDHKEPTTEDKLAFIGANIEGNTDVQNALREIAGTSGTTSSISNRNTPPSRVSNDNTPPSRRNNNDNTPPSKRK